MTAGLPHSRHPVSSVPLKCHNVTVLQKLEQLNGIQPSFILFSIVILTASLNFHDAVNVCLPADVSSNYMLITCEGTRGFYCPLVVTIAALIKGSVHPNHKATYDLLTYPWW